MRKFDYSFLKGPVPGRLIRLCEEVAVMRTKENYHKDQNAGTFQSLREKVVFDSVCSGNAIDGITATDARIQGVIEGDYPNSRDEKMLNGYKDALNLVNIQHDKVKFDQEFIRNLHKMIFSEVMPQEAGLYKQNDIFLFGMGEEGSDRVRLNPISAEDVPVAVEQMIRAYNVAMGDEDIPKLLLIPCVVMDFLRIQPFDEGNERISRLLTSFLLFKSGMDVGGYISLEKLTEKRKDDYYTALEKSSDKWADNENDYIPFAEFILQIVARAYHELDDHFVEVSRKKASKQERIEAILMNTYVPMSKSEIMERLPDVSVRTVEVTLKRLLDEGKIMKVGSFRDARYKKKQ